jgi:hypothetical protein
MVSVLSTFSSGYMISTLFGYSKFPPAIFWSLIGGLAGTALMDIAGIYSEKVKFTSGGE